MESRGASPRVPAVWCGKCVCKQSRAAGTRAPREPPTGTGDGGNGAAVAVKTLDPKADEIALRHQANEVALAGRLRHPNIIGPGSVVRAAGGRTEIRMEYAGGGSLGARGFGLDGGISRRPGRGLGRGRGLRLRCHLGPSLSLICWLELLRLLLFLRLVLLFLLLLLLLLTNRFSCLFGLYGCLISLGTIPCFFDLSCPFFLLLQCCSRTSKDSFD